MVFFIAAADYLSRLIQATHLEIMEVLVPAAAAAAAPAPADGDTAACYICYEEESADNPYIDPSPCSCTGSIRLHIECFRQVRARSETCGICKSKYGEVDLIVSCDYVDAADNCRYVGKRLVISGKFVGALTVYYPSGATCKTKQYTNKGILNGCYKEFYESGQTKEVGNYKYGARHGPYVTYYESGILQKVVEYENNLLHGTYIEYYEDGSVYIRCKYEDGYITGEYTEFYDTGDYNCKLSYEDGHLHGACTYYYPSGSLEKVVQFRRSEVHGTAKYYYDGGAPEKDVIYVNGEAVDETVYGEGGKIKYMRNYRTGTLIEFKNKKKGRK